MPIGPTERTGPLFGDGQVAPEDADLTRGQAAEPIGERIIVSGRVTGSDGRPVRRQLVEIWQANAAGRYRHDADQHPAPLDPNFTGAGRCLTDDDGRYRFVTIKPGEYPWRNHANAWRPAHVHFSVFGTTFTQRLVTQMYFPGDPLLAHDPMYDSIGDREAAQRLVARFDLDSTVEEWALGYLFDIRIGGPRGTPGAGEP
jgi:protocatechuate 3,4-dioxygenase beta subunit